MRFRRARSIAPAGQTRMAPERRGPEWRPNGAGDFPGPARNDGSGNASGDRFSDRSFLHAKKTALFFHAKNL